MAQAGTRTAIVVRVGAFLAAATGIESIPTLEIIARLGLRDIDPFGLRPDPIRA